MSSVIAPRSEVLADLGHLNLENLDSIVNIGVVSCCRW
jgi:hypothetical protein